LALPGLDLIAWPSIVLQFLLGDRQSMISLMKNGEGIFREESGRNYHRGNLPIDEMVVRTAFDQYKEERGRENANNE
jgi:hypothetical protein